MTSWGRRRPIDIQPLVTAARAYEKSNINESMQLGKWVVTVEIFHGTDHELSEEDDYKFYVFTRLKKASLHRVSRVAGCGTWHGDRKSVKIFDDKKKKEGLIGLKKNFTFRIKNGSKKKQRCGISSNGFEQQDSFGDNNLVNPPFVETLKIGGDFYSNNALAVAVASSSQQQPPSTVSFSCSGENGEETNQLAGYALETDRYSSTTEEGINASYEFRGVAQTPQPEYRSVENSSSVLQFNTEKKNFLSMYQEYYPTLESTDQVLKFLEFESIMNPDVMQFNSIDWNNISGVRSENNLVPLPLIQQEGNININGGEGMVIEPELPCFESVIEEGLELRMVFKRLMVMHI
ncbi:hypothetical protein LWI28_025913 [Acer negundo]|uniref:Uncharacterized protein n=1 Tax=Acer negundo TaxID=4023 RepID=A0AAD5IBQ3_ACENE|nr:hypothetical protein LWI28_025913 [Acer negundo]